MDFVPFKAPPTDSHPLNTGQSTENGTTAKSLVDGINASFIHVFDVLKGEAAHIVDTADAEARAHVAELSEAVTALQKQVEALTSGHVALGQTINEVASTVATLATPVKVDPPTAEHAQLQAALARIAELEAQTAKSTA